MFNLYFSFHRDWQRELWQLFAVGVQGDDLVQGMAGTLEQLVGVGRIESSGKLQACRFVHARVSQTHRGLQPSQGPTGPWNLHSLGIGNVDSADSAGSPKNLAALFS